MAKSKSPAKNKAVKSKVSGKAAPKTASSKTPKAATSLVKALAPKKAAGPKPVTKPVAQSMTKPAQPKPIAKKVANKPANSNPSTASAWSESLRKAMQEKNSQKHWPENKTDWKDRQRAGLSMTHRNKFG